MCTECLLDVRVDCAGFGECGSEEDTVPRPHAEEMEIRKETAMRGVGDSTVGVTGRRMTAASSSLKRQLLVATKRQCQLDERWGVAGGGHVGSPGDGTLCVVATARHRGGDAEGRETKRRNAAGRTIQKQSISLEMRTRA